MPLHVVQADVDCGALVPLEFEKTRANVAISLSAIYRTDTPPGPAGRWLLDLIKAVAGQVKTARPSF
ncbi:hypothetical protein F6X42_42080 [Paraburkholderia sp. WC7.3b]|uniref:LysR substrate-binding domain-containing protein n=2 Tax=Burkholderiaceae TaxID=119060 RepID=A0ABR7Q2D9_9BURK|nr:hypothetical protein [Paraburkholderia podalyriae]